jgi:hypothetical protein
MSLTDGDRLWLEGRFKDSHGSLSSKLDEIAKEVGGLKISHAVHVASPCADTARHVARYHNPYKTWGLIGTVIASIIGAVELMKAFWGHR